MLRRILYLVFLILYTSISNAQFRTLKPIKVKPSNTDMSIGVGLTNSVVFLARNTNENNNAIGVTTSAVYALSKFFRLSADYTRYGKINIIPTWYNIRANTVETNLQIIFRSKNSLYFYPQFGLSYNTFSGYFTGKEDYLNLSAIYPQNQNVTSKWLGFNSGVGLEYKISSILAFASAKMRVGFTKGHSDLNILDVCYTFGLRYNFQVPSISKIFHGGNRYNLDFRKKV